MAWMAAIPYIASAAGAVVSNISGQRGQEKGQREANATNIMLSREQRDFEERMSNTAVQRRVEDLRSAGLNPMLAYNDSASTPNYSPARVDNVKAGRAESYGRAANSALAAYMQVAQRTQMELQNANIQAQTVKTSAETDESRARTSAITSKLPGEIEQLSASAAQSRANVEQLGATMPKIAEEIRSLQAARTRTEIETAIARVERYLKELGVPAAEVNSELHSRIGALATVTGATRLPVMVGVVAAQLSQRFGSAVAEKFRKLMEIGKQENMYERK